MLDFTLSDFEERQLHGQIDATNRDAINARRQEVLEVRNNSFRTARDARQQIESFDSRAAERHLNEAEHFTVEYIAELLKSPERNKVVRDLAAMDRDFAHIVMAAKELNKTNG